MYRKQQLSQIFNTMQKFLLLISILIQNNSYAIFALYLTKPYSFFLT